MKKTKLDSEKTNAYYHSQGRKYHNIRVTEGKLFNEFIEIPAVLDLIKKMPIRSVLDVGCGSGIYAKKLFELGYSVHGVDASEEMITIAKEHCNGLDIELVHSPFEQYETPLRFDLALGSFLLGYFEDLSVLFSRMNDYLNPDGKIIVSGVHPMRTSSSSRLDTGYLVKNYFANATYQTQLLPEEDPVEIIHHTFQQISDAASKSNLIIERIIEPVPQIKSSDYKGYRDITSHLLNPSVIVFLLTRRGEVNRQTDC